jgi:hypothetical protein
MVFLNSPCLETPKNVLKKSRKKKSDGGWVGLGFSKSTGGPSKKVLPGQSTGGRAYKEQRAESREPRAESQVPSAKCQVPARQLVVGAKLGCPGWELGGGGACFVLQLGIGIICNMQYAMSKQIGRLRLRGRAVLAASLFFPAI